MEYPFPLSFPPILISNRENESSHSPQSPCNHDLEELMLLTFPKSYERRLRLVASLTNETEEN